MIKILFLIPELSGGGAEKVLCNLVNNMDLSKFDITVQTVNAHDPKEYLKKGIHYKSIIHSETKFGRKWKECWYRFCTEFKLTYPLYIKDDYDIEVAYLECGATKVMAASTNKRAKKIAWVHCDVKKKGLTAKKTGKYYLKYDQVVCVSESSKSSFEEVFSDYAKATVLYNVIDEEEIYQKLQEKQDNRWETDVFHILTVGRICFEKGCDRLLQVCELLKIHGYNFKIHLLGEGPDKEQLIERAKELGVSDYIEFEGFKSNPYPYMNNADLIVIPSRSEALSTVAIESLIMGKPVVTTPCSGMRELFGESEYGIITDDSVESLYINIKRMIDSPNLLKMYAEAARRRGLSFRKEEIVKKTEALFEKLLNNRI